MHRFELIGVIGGRQVRALWDDGNLTVSPALLLGARRLVESAVTFEHGAELVPAGLEDFTAAALTLMRSCEVTAFTVSDVDESAADAPEIVTFLRIASDAG